MRRHYQPQPFFYKRGGVSPPGTPPGQETVPRMGSMAEERGERVGQRISDQARSILDDPEGAALLTRLSTILDQMEEISGDSEDMQMARQLARGDFEVPLADVARLVQQGQEALEEMRLEEQRFRFSDKENMPDDFLEKLAKAAEFKRKQDAYLSVIRRTLGMNRM